MIIHNHNSLSGGTHEGVGTDYGKSGGNVFETDTKMPSCPSEEVNDDQGESPLHESEMAQEVLLGKQNKGNLFRERAIRMDFFTFAFRRRTLGSAEEITQRIATGSVII